MIDGARDVAAGVHRQAVRQSGYGVGQRQAERVLEAGRRVQRKGLAVEYGLGGKRGRCLRRQVVDVPGEGFSGREALVVRCRD